MESKPMVVCLCGSTKFKEAFEKANKLETLRGNIVLSVGFFAHADSVELMPSVKKRLDELHLRKIDLADEVLILDVDGYIGWSTQNEWGYASEKGKRVRFLSKENICPEIN